jgi:hypothetical protein
MATMQKETPDVTPVTRQEEALGWVPGSTSQGVEAQLRMLGVRWSLELVAETKAG